MPKRRGYYDFDYYPPSRPREAKGGIKAQSRRGGFGESWWAKRWISVLEAFQIGARLGRGRSYARSGQVLAVEVEKGRVAARVQGSRPTPYTVTIRVKALAAAEWGKVGGVLAGEALFAAKLLAGEMPRDIERAFREAGLTLFPAKAGDLETSCSCPDWSNPCKHIAAVYYLLGEEFDRDPFLVFRLRGLSRKELTRLLGGPSEARGDVPEVSRVEPLDPDPDRFWRGGTIRDDLFGAVEFPAASASLVKRLGSFPFWRGEQNLAAALEPVYRAAAAKGLEVFAGSPGPDEEEASPTPASDETPARPRGPGRARRT